MTENTKNPTPQQYRDLAEKVLGYQVEQWIARPDGVVEWYGRKPAKAYTCWHTFNVDDRNWVAEVLARLTDEQWKSVGLLLRVDAYQSEEYREQHHSMTRWLLSATPGQIAEAVWRATCQ